MADWSRLSPDLVGLITERLGVADLIRFGSVCKSWRSISGPPRRGGLLPWLIIPYGDKEDNDDARVVIAENFCRDGLSLGVFSLYDGKIYRLDLPEVTQTRICGSSTTGWLATVHSNSEMKLVHAFTRSQIQLPPLTDFPDLSDLRFSEERGTFVYSYNGFAHEETSDDIRDFYIDKLVVTSFDPLSSAHQHVVIAIYGRFGRLAMFRSTGNTRRADESWTLLGASATTNVFDDVTYYKGRFYAVDELGWVYMIDGLDSSSPLLTLVSEPPPCSPLTNKERRYLVESSGDLLQVLSYIYIDFKDSFRYMTTGFRVFKQDFSGPKWVEVQSMGDRLLFIGYNASFSLSAVDVPSCSKRNCIYFTDDNGECFNKEHFGGYDLGVFNLDDRTLEPCYSIGSQLIMPSPIWLATNQCNS